MGIDLVKAVLLQHSSDLTGRAVKVLTYMATVALDRRNEKGQPARLYYAGEEPLVHVLYGLGAEPTPHRLREVRRVLKELRDDCLIEPQVAKAGYNRAQCYLLRVGSLGGESAPDLGGETAHPTEGEIAPGWVGKPPTPRTHEEPAEDLSKDSMPQLPEVPTDRASPALQLIHGQSGELRGPQLARELLAQARASREAAA